LILFGVLLLCREIPLANGFASWFAEDEQYCIRKMEEGQIIMNNRVVSSEDRTVQVFRGDEQLSSGAEYFPGEELSVVLSDVTAQFVFETTRGEFENGGCNGRRFIESPAKLILPKESSDDVRIWAGWAFGHSTVLISSSFMLKGTGDGSIADSVHEDGSVDETEKKTESPITLRGAVKVLRAQAHNRTFLYITAFIMLAIVAATIYKFCIKFRSGKTFSKAN
jgi:hypothetical protein